MPSPALARLESLLGAHKLDHTLTSRLPPVHEDGQAGLPRGQISEIVGPRSSGRQTVLVSRLAAATGCGELVALVDPLDMFDPVSAAAHGVELSRMLWVRGCAVGPDRVSLPREAGEAGVQVERAVKALNLILQASGFGLVALDLGEISLPVLGRVPFTTWRRLHRVIEGGETACVVVAAAPVARSVGGITVALPHVLATLCRETSVFQRLRHLPRIDDRRPHHPCPRLADRLDGPAFEGWRFGTLTTAES